MKAPVSLTSDELLAVLAKARDRRLRDWVILVTIYWHGFRVSEVVRSSTRQRGLFFTRAKAEQRLAEMGDGAGIGEVERLVKGKRRICYLVTSEQPLKRPGLTLEAIEGQEVTIQRLKRSMETVQGIQEHENPLLNERLAWDEWLAERNRYGKKGGAKMQQNKRFVAKPRKRLAVQHLPQPAFPALPRLCQSRGLTPAQTASSLSEAHHRNPPGGRGHPIARGASASRTQVAGFNGTIYAAAGRSGVARGGQSDSGERRVPALPPRIPLPKVVLKCRFACLGMLRQKCCGPRGSRSILMAHVWTAAELLRTAC
jgi:hypothetical protein